MSDMENESIGVRRSGGFVRWLTRLRHGRGFGVHSPFAFRLITEVLRERLPYYAFGHITDRRSQLVYRLAARFNPSTMAFIGGENAAARECCPQASLTEAGAAAFVVADGAGATAASIAAAVHSDAVIVTINATAATENAVEEAVTRLGHGMTFTNDRGMHIAATFAHLPRQTFAVKF